MKKGKIILREEDALTSIRIGKWEYDKDLLKQVHENMFWSYKVWPPSSIRSKEGRVWLNFPEDMKLEESNESMKGIYEKSNNHANFFESK